MVFIHEEAHELTLVVGAHQSAFIRGRCLHDNYMMVQCTAKKLQASSTSSVMLKLDITKAFDTLDWAFLMEVLQQLGFGPKWMAWVAGLLASFSTRVLLNGILGDVIYKRQGLQ